MSSQVKTLCLAWCLWLTQVLGILVVCSLAGCLSLWPGLVQHTTAMTNTNEDTIKLEYAIYVIIFNILILQSNL